jgi:simple sugar transport system permease protein
MSDSPISKASGASGNEKQPGSANALATLVQRVNPFVRKTLTGSDQGFLLLITIGLFVAMYVAGMIVFADKNFDRPQVFLNLFISNAGLIVISLGLTVVMISGGIDISVGGVTALVCMVCAFQMESNGASAQMAIVWSLGIGLVFGVVQGFLVAYLDIQPFIVTLAGMFFARGMTAVVAQEQIAVKNETFLSWMNYRINIPGVGYTNRAGELVNAYIYPSVVIALVLTLAVVLLMKYSHFGRSLYAVGGNAASAMMMGINVKWTKFRAYVLSGFLAGVGGFLFLLNSGSGFVEQARGLEMEAISSSVIGGTLLSGGVGMPFGTLFGVMINGTIKSLISFQGNLNSWWVRIVLSALLCFFIVLQAVLAARRRKA